MPRARTYQTEAIIIKKTRLGEADRILTLYTPELGKIQGIAKGVRRPKAKLSGHLELLTHSMVSLVQGRNLDTIIGSQTIHSFLPLKCDLELGACALYATELVGHFATERQENRPLFSLLLGIMSELSKCASAGAQRVPPSEAESDSGYPVEPATLLRYFEVHLLQEAGYRPQLCQCVGCLRPLVLTRASFSAAAGGVLCPQCLSKYSFSYPLSAAALSAFQALQEGDWPEARVMRCDAGVRQEMEALMRHYLRYLLERDIRSAAWLDTLAALERRTSRLPAK